jgi:hypothetical protein
MVGILTLACCLDESIGANECLVIINSIPYFGTRLKGSGVENTFGSYFSFVMTLANFGFLWHSTVTSSRVCRFFVIYRLS